MTWIVFGVIVTFVLFIALGFDTKKGNWHFGPRQIGALLGLLLILPSMFATVPTGHTGILTLFGEVQNDTLEAGLHIKNPLMKLVAMDNRTQRAVIKTECFSSDIQEVQVIYSLNFQIEKQNAMNAR